MYGAAQFIFLMWILASCVIAIPLVSFLLIKLAKVNKATGFFVSLVLTPMLVFIFLFLETSINNFEYEKEREASNKERDHRAYIRQANENIINDAWKYMDENDPQKAKDVMQKIDYTDDYAKADVVAAYVALAMRNEKEIDLLLKMVGHQNKDNEIIPDDALVAYLERDYLNIKTHEDYKRLFNILEKSGVHWGEEDDLHTLKLESRNFLDFFDFKRMVELKYYDLAITSLSLVRKPLQDNLQNALLIEDNSLKNQAIKVILSQMYDSNDENNIKTEEYTIEPLLIAYQIIKEDPNIDQYINDMAIEMKKVAGEKTMQWKCLKSQKAQEQFMQMYVKLTHKNELIKAIPLNIVQCGLIDEENINKIGENNYIELKLVLDIQWGIDRYHPYSAGFPLSVSYKNNTTNVVVAELKPYNEDAKEGVVICKIYDPANVDSINFIKAYAGGWSDIYLSPLPDMLSHEGVVKRLRSLGAYYTGGIYDEDKIIAEFQSLYGLKYSPDVFLQTAQKVNELYQELIANDKPCLLGTINKEKPCVAQYFR